MWNSPICFSNGSPYGGCGCFAWLSRPFWAPLPICLWRTLLVIAWIVWQILLLITLAISTLIRFIGLIWPVLFYFFLVGLAAFLWWYLYPELAPYIAEVVVPLLNMWLTLSVFAWNLFVLFWNLLVQIWNAMAPIIGMLLYIALESMVTMVTNIVKLLGEVHLYALLKPFMEILQQLAAILVEIIQALCTVAIPALNVMAKVIGAVINVIFQVVDQLFPIVQWVLIDLFTALASILQLVVAVVNWAVSYFSARSLLGLEDQPGGGPWDGFHQTTYAQMYAKASPYWGRKSYQQAKMQEIDIINQMNAQHPRRSFDYYWTVHRPHLQHLQSANAVPIFKGVQENRGGGGGGAGRRTLLSVATERKLLTDDEVRVLETVVPVTRDEYWARYDRSPADHHEWYKQQLQAHITRQNEIISRLPRDILELVEEQEGNSYDAPVQNPWQNELHKKVRCRSVACGGVGTPLPHPILTLRNVSWERQERETPRESPWKSPHQTQEEWDRERFIYVHAGSQALLGAIDITAFYLQDPQLQKHASTAWRQVTGHDDFHSFFEKEHTEHGNFYEFVHDKFSGLSDLPGLKELKEQDPSALQYPYYSDWLRAVRLEQRRNRNGRKLTYVVVPEEDSNEVTAQRRLMSVEEDALMRQWRQQTRNTIAAIRNNDEYQQHLGRVYEATRAAVPDDDATVEDLYEEDATWMPVAERRLLGSFANGSLPFQPNPFPNADSINAEASRRQGVLNSQRTTSTAYLPLFQLLAETNCYDSTPRNPLCLPFIPTKWLIKKTPQITWPTQLNGTLDCSYLYCDPPHELTFSTIVNWCWIRNGLQSIRFVVSALAPLFTGSIGQLISKYGAWLGWLLRPLLVFPPGYVPTENDWVCFIVFGPYALWFLALNVLLFVLFIWPLIVWLTDLILSWEALYGMFVGADSMRWDALRQTDWYFYRVSRDPYVGGVVPPTRTGPGTPAYKQPPTGGEHLPVPSAASQFTGGNNLSAYFPQVQSAGGAITTTPDSANSFRRASPYTDQSTIEEYKARQEQIFSNVASQEERTRHALGMLEEALLESVQEMGMPARQSAISSEASSSSWWNRALRWWREMNGANVTVADVTQFERTYGSLLTSYQMAPYWIWQRKNYLATQRRIKWTESPIEGPYKRGYTRQTHDKFAQQHYPHRFPSPNPLASPPAAVTTTAPPMQHRGATSSIV
jgi:hypothetical protein